MFRFEGPITMDRATAALAAATRAIDAGETAFALDALGASDSSAVAVLVAACRHADARSRSLTLSGAPESVRSLARLYGVEELIHIAA